MSAPLRTGRCPGCGANLEFRIGSSRATVCEYCKTVVARAGQELTAVGKVADLIPTGSRIALGSSGRFEGAAFEVVGRLQYEWTAGVWDEWNLAFADGRAGWLAEAQGRFYVTFLSAPRLLPAKVSPGQSVFLSGLGRFTVTDLKQAKIVGAAGELPDSIALGDAPTSADLESDKGGFATLDFGTAAHPGTTLFLGKQVAFDELSLSALTQLAEQKQARPTGEALRCPGCGAPVSLRLPEQTVRFTCPSCGKLIDCSKGPLEIVAAIQRGKREPRIPLGSEGSLRGRGFVVAGWMVRSCKVDGVRYPWAEYLLWEEKAQAFAFLVESDGHWQLATPLSAGRVDAADDASYDGRRFRHFSAVAGEVETVLGEFYWKVHQGESALLDDYVRPPEGLSRERGDGEVNWSHLEHLDRAEVAQAFGRPGLAQAEQEGVGEIQPWPFEAAWPSIGRWAVGGALALVCLLAAFSLRPETVLVNQSFSAGSGSSAVESATSPDGERVQSFISAPFQLSGHEALRVEFTASLDQTWAYVAGAVINDESGESSPFSIEASHYSGVDDGEAWSEGSPSGAEAISAPGAGRAIVRADLQWEPKKREPSMHLLVTSSSYSGWQFLAGLGLLLAWPVLLATRRAAFEKARWENSNVHPSA